MITNGYIPGVCNIGQTEIRLRKRVGWISLGVTLLLGVFLVACHTAPAWRLVLFFPAMTAAISYLQAAWHFCAKFGLGGVFNFGPNVGKTDSVEQAEWRRQDRAKAWKIIALSVLAGALVAVVAYLLPF